MAFVRAHNRKQQTVMTGYNLSIGKFEPMGYGPSTIYACFYLCYIPVGHALQCLFVYGWPKEYLPNLLSNAPIGLTAMVIGTTLTGLLSKISFNAFAEETIASVLGKAPPSAEEEEGEFYSSLVVMVATGVWCFVLGNIVNSGDTKKSSQPAKDPAKEL